MVAASTPPSSPPGTLLNGSAVAASAVESLGWYTIETTGGLTISFERLEVSGDWLRLLGIIGIYGGVFHAAAVSLEMVEVRSRDVRLIAGGPKK